MFIHLGKLVVRIQHISVHIRKGRQVSLLLMKERGSKIREDCLEEASAEANPAMEDFNKLTDCNLKFESYCY